MKEDRQRIEKDQEGDANKNDRPIDIHDLAANHIEVEPERQTEKEGEEAGYLLSVSIARE